MRVWKISELFRLIELKIGELSNLFSDKFQTCENPDSLLIIFVNFIKFNYGIQKGFFFLNILDFKTRVV
jgi:hypothetical protein